MILSFFDCIEIGLIHSVALKKSKFAVVAELFCTISELNFLSIKENENVPQNLLVNSRPFGQISENFVHFKRIKFVLYSYVQLYLKRRLLLGVLFCSAPYLFCNLKITFKEFSASHCFQNHVCVCVCVCVCARALLFFNL